MNNSQGTNPGRGERMAAVGMASAAMAMMLSIALGGCMQSEANDWAQTSPVLKPDRTMTAPVRLGAAKD